MPHDAGSTAAQRFGTLAWVRTDELAEGIDTSRSGAPISMLSGPELCRPSTAAVADRTGKQSSLAHHVIVHSGSRARCHHAGFAGRASRALFHVRGRQWEGGDKCERRARMSSQSVFLQSRLLILHEGHRGEGQPPERARMEQAAGSNQ
jgi:hypothetical protein